MDKLPWGIGRPRTKLHAIMTETHQQLQIGNLDVKLGKLRVFRQVYPGGHPSARPPSTCTCK